MPKSRDDIVFIEDIINSIKDIQDFLKNIQFEEFNSDRKTIAAVIRNLEIIGEAIKNVPNHIRTQFKDIPWKEYAGMRDKLIHEYFGVDLQIVWKTSTIELIELKNQFEDILKILKEKEK